MPGRYVPYDGLLHVNDAPSRVEFEPDGQPLVLTACSGKHLGSLIGAVHRRDQRRHHPRGHPVLSLGVPDADGAVTLDSTGRRTSRAPTPTWPPVRCRPRGTTFPVAVEAGERIPDERLEESTRA